MRRYAVSTRINQGQNDDAECTESRWNWNRLHKAICLAECDAEACEETRRSEELTGGNQIAVFRGQSTSVVQH